MSVRHALQARGHGVHSQLDVRQPLIRRRGGRHGPAGGRPPRGGRYQQQRVPAQAALHEAGTARKPPTSRPRGLLCSPCHYHRQGLKVHLRRGWGRRGSRLKLRIMSAVTSMAQSTPVARACVVAATSRAITQQLTGQTSTRSVKKYGCHCRKYMDMLTSVVALPLDATGVNSLTVVQLRSGERQDAGQAILQVAPCLYGPPRLVHRHQLHPLARQHRSAKNALEWMWLRCQRLKSRR